MNGQNNGQNGDFGVNQLNQGVNYMQNNQQNDAQQPMNQVQNTSQPIVNTALVKEKANVFVGKANGVLNNTVANLKTNKNYQVGAIVIVVVVLLLLLGKYLSPSYRVVNSYMSGMKNFNAEKIVKLLHEDMYEDEDDEIDDLEDDFDEYEDKDYSIKSYKIVDSITYTESQLETVAESFETWYDIDEKDVKAVKQYIVKIKADNDGDKEYSYSRVTVVKIEGKWYLWN